MNLYYFFKLNSWIIRKYVIYVHMYVFNDIYRNVLSLFQTFAVYKC